MRCEGVVSKNFLRVNPDRETQCRRIADFCVEGKNLCAEHTSMRLLEQANRAGAIKRVARSLQERETR